MFKPSGVYAAMLTPFQQDGSINEAVLRSMVEFMINKGLHGLFPVSSIGEFAHMPMEQAIECMEIVVDQARGRVPVTPGVSATCAEHSIKLARKAQELGCPAVVICPPYYYAVTQGVIQKHFEAVADAIDIPVILYNIPLFSQAISYDVVANLSEKANIIAMKDSSGSMVDLMHFMDVSKNMSILTGREDMFYPALVAGAQGCMTATAGIVPEIMLGIWDAYHAGDADKAKRLQFAILPLLRAMFTPQFPNGFKAALEVRGFDMGARKQALSEVDEDKLAQTKIRIENIMRDLRALVKQEGLDKAQQVG